MAKNVLLTSLSAAEYDPQLRYYSIPNEFGAGYCDALLDTEAGIKAVLARSEIDEIVIIGGSGAYNGEDELKPALLTSGVWLILRTRRRFPPMACSDAGSQNMLKTSLLSVMKRMGSCLRKGVSS